MDPVSKRRLHPLIAAAAVSVIVLSAVGVAAITGLLPISFGSSVPVLHATASTPTAAQASAAPKEAARIGATPLVANREPPRLRTAQLARTLPKCQDCGVVESVHVVEVKGKGTGLGAVAGGVVGALLGNQLGNGGGRTLLTLGGAAGGAYAGNEIEKSERTSRHWDVDVRLTDGHTRVVSYKTEPPWRRGDHVRVVNGVIEPLR